ncbi:MAG: hypothetical protein KDA89_18655 [Planctomycetaceae bacterium]|nr:hypothetical protein [Planctomycetaceae bacterium]
MSRLSVLFLKHADREYVRNGEPTGEAANFRQALRSLTSYFHGVRIIDFGPKKLKDLRSRLVSEGLSQSTVNSRLRRIKQVFDWGVSEELVPVAIAQALRSVKGIRRGKTEARPPQPKPPVPIEHVSAIRPHVTRPVWGLIQFALLTGCRPSEACAVRWSQIVTSGRVWVFVPTEHKTSHINKRRTIVIGPKAQTLLNSFRELSRSDYVFDPQVGLEEFVRQEYGEHAKARCLQGWQAAETEGTPPRERVLPAMLTNAVRNIADNEKHSPAPAIVAGWGPLRLLSAFLGE